MTQAAMQAAWVLESNEVDYAKATRLMLRRIYLDVRAEHTNRSRIDDVHAHGYEAGVYWGANWGELAMGPDRHAKHFSDLIVAYGTTQCAAQVDFEHHDPEWILAWLRAWRALRPLKWTSWTMESFQGGWFTRELVDFVNADVNLVVVPQLYKGDMTVRDGLNALLDLAAAGVDIWRVQGFFNAAPDKLPSDWRGCLFTLETA